MAHGFLQLFGSPLALPILHAPDGLYVLTAVPLASGTWCFNAPCRGCSSQLPGCQLSVTSTPSLARTLPLVRTATKDSTMTFTISATMPTLRSLMSCGADGISVATVEPVIVI